MNASDSSFSETNPKAKHKLCGNCGRVSFGLNKEEAEFLVEAIKFYGLPTMRNWLKKKGTIKMVGGSKAPDPEKMRVLQLLKNHFKICPVENVEVTPIDEHCFAWIPQEALPLEDNHIIRQRVFRELQKNPSLYLPYRASNIRSQRFSPKILCEALGLAWPKYKGCVSQACTDYKRLLRNKGYLGRKARLE